MNPDARKPVLPAHQRWLDHLQPEGLLDLLAG